MPTDSSRLALGCHWAGWVAPTVSTDGCRRDHVPVDASHNACQPQAEPTIWRRDRFDAKRSDIVRDMAKHFHGADVTLSRAVEMLDLVQADKLRCRQLLHGIIEQMWLEVGNCCGLRVLERGGIQRPLASRGDLRQALKAVTPPLKLHMLLHFVFNYVRDALYPATLMVTHQLAVEQAALILLNVRFATSDLGGAPSKTCLAKLYGEIYNDRKQRLVKAVLEPGYSVVVEHKNLPKPKSWKRNKHICFLYRKAFAGQPEHTTEVCCASLVRTVSAHHSPMRTPVGPPELSRVLQLEGRCRAGIAVVNDRGADPRHGAGTATRRARPGHCVPVGASCPCVRCRRGKCP
jgi:hypothetical protein